MIGAGEGGGGGAAAGHGRPDAKQLAMGCTTQQKNTSGSLCAVDAADVRCTGREWGGVGGGAVLPDWTWDEVP
jgi:hypothetical protein